MISHGDYNEKVGRALFCPITSKEKGYLFEVKIKAPKVDGVVLSDQVKSLEWKARRIEFIGKITKDTFVEVKSRLLLLVT